MQRSRRKRIRMAAFAVIALLACTFVHSMQLHLHLFHTDHASAANHSHEGEIHLCSFTCDEQHLNEAHIVDVDGNWLNDPNIKYKLSPDAAPVQVVLIDLAPNRSVCGTRENISEPTHSDHVTPPRRAPPPA